MMGTMLEEYEGQVWNKVERMIVWCWDGQGRKTQPLTLEPRVPCPRERSLNAAVALAIFPPTSSKLLEAPAKIKAQAL